MMTTTERQRPEAAFIEHLCGLVKGEDLAALAALRRGLGREPGSAPEMYPYVVPYLPEGLTARQEDAYYLVAALFAWHQQDWPNDDDPYRSNLGASLARLRWEHAAERGENTLEEGDSTERRFVAMLSSSREDLPYHLRQMIALLRVKEVPVNWRQLLSDIQRWDAPIRNAQWDGSIHSVQRRWASAFWGQFAPEQPAAAPATAPDEDQPTDDESTAD